MTHISPAATLSWTVYSTIFECFLLSHLYQYDRFRCLSWRAGPQAGGAFKRVMTLTYLSTVPLLMCYAIGFTYIKYNQGLIYIPIAGVHPKPSSLWPESLQRWIIPLYYVFSVGWSLEMVTHLEEFTFWLFLLSYGPHEISWFSSYQFRMWFGGSILAVVGMPLVVSLTKNDVLRCEAWLFFVGSVGSTTITVMFLYILWCFPAFLRDIQSSVPDGTVLARLKRVHRLNITRVVFRFLFTLPLLCLGIDGLWGTHAVNESFFAPDLFVMLAGLSCMVSSAITLHIFFPLDHANESEQDAQQVSMYSTRSRNPDPFAPPPTSPPLTAAPASGKMPLIHPDEKDMFKYPPRSRADSISSEYDEEEVIGWPEPERSRRVPSNGTNRLAPSRKSSSVGVKQGTISRRQSAQSLHPYIATYTSPIELVPLPSPADRIPRAV